MTVGELFDRMGAREYDQWRDYYAIEPFGQERDNWHMGTLASLYMQAHSKPGGKKASANDFMYRTADEARKRSTKAAIDALGAMATKKAAG